MNYTFQNRTTAPIIFIVEPWAEEFTVPSGSVLSIEIFSSELGVMETFLDGTYFTVWLWGGCRAAVSLDGNHQTRPALLIPVPSTFPAPHDKGPISLRYGHHPNTMRAASP
jgi:hypothetical protein